MSQDGRPVASKSATKQQADASLVKRPDAKASKSATVDPIQLPASFKDAFKYKVRHQRSFKLLAVCLLLAERRYVVIGTITATIDGVCPSHFQGLDSSDIKLDFTFDAALAKLSEDHQMMSPHKEIGEPPEPIPMPGGASGGNSHMSSAAHDTNDLGLKIASVKKVWDEYDNE